MRNLKRINWDKLSSITGVVSKLGAKSIVLGLFILMGMFALPNCDVSAAGDETGTDLAVINSYLNKPDEQKTKEELLAELHERWHDFYFKWLQLEAANIIANRAAGIVTDHTAYLAAYNAAMCAAYRTVDNAATRSTYSDYGHCLYVEAYKAQFGSSYYDARITAAEAKHNAIQEIYNESFAKTFAINWKKDGSLYKFIENADKDEIFKFVKVLKDNLPK